MNRFGYRLGLCAGALMVTVLAGGAWLTAGGADGTPAARDRAAVAAKARERMRASVPAWFEPFDPFRIIGPVHYVGSRGLGMFFIPTDEGHILIDGGIPENAPMIAENIRTLGYAPEDIRILLNTHAHFDHSGGLAEMKALSGAQLIASEGDRSALEGGFYLGFEDNAAFDAPPVAVDRVIGDGETVSLGGITLTANVTPGHTRGCTSWTLTVEEAGTDYDVLIFCSASVALNRLVREPQYPGIVEDYRKTFRITHDWRPDVFLSNHAEFFAMEAKRARQIGGDALAFVDPDAFPPFIAKAKNDFKSDLKRQQAELTEKSAEP